MSREDVQKLLGGYATGTLTAEERQTLFEAALEDQELFDALAREEALREVLSDPMARAQLLAAVDEAPAPWYRRWWRPVPMAVLATALLAVTGVAVWQNSREPRPRKMARFELPIRRAEEAPILPPPPELARTAPPALVPFPLPAAMPAAAPAPPPVAAPPLASQAAPANEQKDAVTVTGSAAPLNQFQQSQALGQIQALPSNARFAPVAGKALVARDASLHGIVTDSSGAAIRSVSVAVKSVATGEVVTTSTNERGEFSAPAVPGGAYQISASAPGFRPATVSRVTPVFGEPEPVNLRLDVGTATETVEVSAAATAIAAPMGASGGGGGGGRGGRGGGAMAGAVVTKKQAPAAEPRQQAAPLGLDYRILRRMPGGDLVEIAADRTVAAGATVILQIIPNADGYLRISRSNGRAIVTHAVRRGQPFEAQLPKFGKPERVELQVVFSRRPIQANAPVPAQRASAGAVTGSDALAEPISVAITINFR
jgi:hypothetical protein